MNRLVMLSEIKKVKEESNLNIDISEEYYDFKEKFFGNYLDKEESNKIDVKSDINSTYLNVLNKSIGKIFSLNNKRPFIDFLNKIFDDCLGTNCDISYSYNDKSIKGLKNKILKNSSYDIKISIKDDYRLFEYNIQLQTDDYENIAIAILKNTLNNKVTNIINFKQKKRQYSISNIKREKLSSNSDLYFIMLNSTIRVPDSYEVRDEYNGNHVLYKFNILKGWKYNFKDLYKNDLYLLFPLKILDLKKGITYMKNSGYSNEIIEKEKN